ncbi:MAG: class I SAM-dependent methyltransferase [Acidimicrobiales bacterium]
MSRFSVRSLPRTLRQALRRGRALRNRVVGDVLMELPGLSAKSYPIAADEASFLTVRSRSGAETDVLGSAAAEGSALPVPKARFREGYGDTVEQYLDLGRGHVATMRSVLTSSGRPIEEATRILDFGCSAGSMLRWLEDLVPGRALWGVDVNAANIQWAQEHLSPPFFFAATTSFPHLPFEDGWFDLVYSGSVFSHIADLADAWLLELRRILRPNGRAYLTVHDKHSIEVIYDRHPMSPLAEVLTDFRGQHGVDVRTADFSVLTIARAPRTSVVFYDIDHLTRRWERFFRVVSVTEEAYGYQTALLLEKRNS